MTVGAFAQGTINFQNSLGTTAAKSLVYDFNPSAPTVAQYGQSAADNPTGGTVYGGALIGGAGAVNYSVQLWAVAGLNQAESSLVAVAGTLEAFKTAAPLAGSFPSITVAIPNAPANVATLQVRAWYNAGGTITTWAQAVANGYYGSSATFNANLTTFGTPLNIVGNADSAYNMQSFSLVQVPEPSTIALGVMGLGALLIRPTTFFGLLFSLRSRY